MIKKIFVFLLVALVAIQFIRPAKNKSNGLQPNYIGSRFTIPSDIKSILAKACNDCHSNNTTYPWYASLQPVLWWMDGHIKEGLKGLNLDEYTNRSLRYQYHKMEDIIEQLKKGEMPLNSYTWMHKSAVLTMDEKTKITDWANVVMSDMKARYPADSLIKKKK